MAVIHNLDARQIADVLEPESVQACICSPPYWGLRDYGLEPSVWGGDPECNHEWTTERVYNTKITRKASSEKWTRADGTTANADALKEARWKEDTRCVHCGAWRGCLGLEPTPEQFVANIVEVFRAVWKVLRPDGTLWLNLGDSYWGAGGANNNSGITGRRPEEGADKDERDNPVAYRARWGRRGALKPKDLVGIPWRVAFALQEDGWYLRSDIIWSKPNPMPESVIDRPTKAHEYVFLLTKSPRYYYDAEAIREPSSWNPTNTKMPDGWNTGPGAHGNFHPNGREKGRKNDATKSGRVRGSLQPHKGFAERWDGMTREEQAAYGRNKRSVWTIATRPYPEAHFATFPENLVEPCILAGTSPQACPVCRAPWKRVVEVERRGVSLRNPRKLTELSAHGPVKGGVDPESRRLGPRVEDSRRTLGWQPSCTCEGNDGSGRCIVLDPFAGSGTTLRVAERLGREAVGFELNPDYIALIERRLRHNQMQLTL